VSLAQGIDVASWPGGVPGFSDEGDLVVGEDVEIGGNVSIGGDITIIGVIFSDDHTEIVGSLSVGDDLDVRGNILDGAGDAVDILDEYLSVSGDLTVWGDNLYVGGSTVNDGYVHFRDGEETLAWDVGESRFSFSDTVHSTNTFIFGGTSATTEAYNIIAAGATISPSGLMDGANDLYVEGDIEVGGNLSLGGDVTIIGVIFGDDYTKIMGNLTVGRDLDVRGKIFDGAGRDVDIADNVSISEDLTIQGADIYVGGTSDDGRVRFRGGSEEIFWDESESLFQVTDDERIGGIVTVTGGAIIGEDTGDIFVVTSSGLNVFEDGRLFDAGSAVEVQDSLSVSGDLTVLGSTRLGDSSSDTFVLQSSGFIVEVEGTVHDNDSAFRVFDDMSITGELSVENELEVYGGGISRFRQGRIYIGNLDPSALAAGSGDLFVQSDTEIGDDVSIQGDVSIGGNLSVAGEIKPASIPGTISPIFTIDANDDTTTPTLAFYTTNSETFRWNDEVSSFEMSDDLSIAGSLTTEKELIVNGSDVSEFVNGRVSIGSSPQPSIAGDPGDLYVEGDVEVGGNLSLGGSVTIAGVIFGDDHTKIIGSLSVGDDLDVRGNIFDGAGAEVDILDDLSVSGDLRVFGSDLYLGVSGGDDDVVRFDRSSDISKLLTSSFQRNVSLFVV